MSDTETTLITTAVDDAAGVVASVAGDANGLLTTVEKDATAAGAAVQNAVTKGLSEVAAFLSKNGQALPAAVLSDATAAISTAEQAYGTAVTTKANALVSSFLATVPGGSIASPVALDLLDAFLAGLGFAPATPKAS